MSIQNVSILRYNYFTADDEFKLKFVIYKFKTCGSIWSTKLVQPTNWSTVLKPPL